MGKSERGGGGKRMSYFNGFAMKSDDWPLMNIGALMIVFCKGTTNTVQMTKGNKNLTNIDCRPCFQSQRDSE